MPSGLAYHFHPAPQQPGHYALAVVEDLYGHALRFIYSERGHLQAIADSAGRHIGVRTNTAGQILALDLPHADGTPGTFPAVQYTYDKVGNMLVSINAEGQALHLAYGCSL